MNKTISYLQPWLVTIMERTTCQRVDLLALGATPKAAQKHVRAVAAADQWEITNTMRITTRTFVCAADIKNTEVLIDIREVSPW